VILHHRRSPRLLLRHLTRCAPASSRRYTRTRIAITAPASALKSERFAPQHSIALTRQPQSPPSSSPPARPHAPAMRTSAVLTLLAAAATGALASDNRLLFTHPAQDGKTFCAAYKCAWCVLLRFILCCFALRPCPASTTSPRTARRPSRARTASRVTTRARTRRRRCAHCPPRGVSVLIYRPGARVLRVRHQPVQHPGRHDPPRDRVKRWSRGGLVSVTLTRTWNHEHS
jgi:hypothetical protein